MLFNFAARQADTMEQRCSNSELLIFSHRLFRAIAVIEQATTSHYLRVTNERVNEREERLRRFNRMVSHELKNRVGAVLGAGELIQEEWLPDEERHKFAGIVLQNARALQQVLENLTELSRLDPESRRQRNIMLREAVSEVLRQQRELLRAHDVELIVEELPAVEVNAAAVELCLSNYISNAVKYSSPSRKDRWVRVAARLDAEDGGSSATHLTVFVEDNGVGIAPEQRERLFSRFYRAEGTAHAVEGTGLGLSLVRETLEAMGGRAWAEFPGDKTVFAFSMPCRRRRERHQTPFREAPSRAHG